MAYHDLLQLQHQLISAKTAEERISILDCFPNVQKWLRSPSYFAQFLRTASIETACALKQLAAVGQAIDPDDPSKERWDTLAALAVAIDRFYWEIGGIVGYQASVLRILGCVDEVDRQVVFHSPVFDDISEPNAKILESVRLGLEALPFLAELYPLGGAADRLHLVDVATGLELPAAKLPFAGRTLFETLVRDLQAREWLYYRLYGRQITVPIAVMTSQEKNNHRHVLNICEENHWFGRPKDSFRLFTQPLVPTVDEKGNWHLSGKLCPVLKPGGHGAIWKIMRDEKIFDWFASHGCKKGLVRQINNPIAGIDYGLIAFAGIGCARDQWFGFASCPRRVSAAEGMIVLKEKEGKLALTNVEYCDFAKHGIEDEPIAPGDTHSRFSSNTNILFIDLKAVEQAVATTPFPGLLMNLKQTHLTDEKGDKKEVFLGRLESTMQNIADVFEEPMDLRMQTEKTFVTYNRRQKTISVAKKAYLPGNALLETPECCFYELLQENRELLAQCGFALPVKFTPDEYLVRGPDAVFLYHPALGPLYSVIQQKLRNGRLGSQSEFALEISELDASDLCIEGSLRILAERILGKQGEETVRYSDRVGRCILKDVQVRNRGVDWKKSSPFWKMDLSRIEGMEIILQGDSEFDAEGVVFEGDHRFVVEDGVRMVVRQKDGAIAIAKEPVGNKPLWTYSWNEGVLLTR